MLLILAGSITVMGYSELQGSCYHAISTCPHFALNARDSLPALCLCQLLFLKVCELDIKTWFYMSLNSTILSLQASEIINHLYEGANMLAYWGGGCTDQDMNNIRVDRITGSQNVVEGIV